MTAAGSLSLKIGTKTYPVETYADASEMVLEALAKYHGYYRDLPSIDLLNSRGQKVGHVSTNGRVWLSARGPAVQVWPMRGPEQIGASV